MAFDLDKFDENRAFKTIEYLAEKIGPRLSGTESEEKTANYLKQEFEKISKTATFVEKYEHTFYSGKEAVIFSIFTGNKYTGKPMYMSKSTAEEGLEGEGFYIGSINELEKYTKEDLRGKIVFLFLSRDYLEPEVFRQLRLLYKMKPICVILLTTYHQEVIRSDPFFEIGSIFSFVPTMLIPSSKLLPEAENLTGNRFNIRISGNTEKGKLFNIGFDLKGKRKETIVLCAHHDTVEYSKGVRYNASGVAIILELARILNKNQLNFSYRIISFGGEEQGLDGAIKHLKNSKTEDVILSLNFEGIEALPGFIASIVAGDNSLYKLIQEISEENYYPALAINSAPTGGDCMIFIEESIPSILHTIKGSSSYGQNHTELDNLENYSSSAIKEMGRFALSIINKLEEMEEELEFSLSIPYNIEEEVDRYFERFKEYQK